MSGKTSTPSPTLPLADDNALREEDLPVIKEFLPEARGYLEVAENSLAKLAEDVHDAETIDAVFRAFHTIKGVAGFLNLRQIGALAHSTESLLAGVRASSTPLGRDGIDLVLQAVDVMNGLMKLLETAVEQSSPLPDDARVSPLLSRLEKWDAADKPKEVERPDRSSADAAASDESTGALPASTAKPSAKTTMRVSTERLDALINLVGELVVAQAMVNEDVAPLAIGNQKLGRNISHLSKIARNLQDLSLSMRMVPVRGPFQKMFRLVRDLAAKSGKQVELITEGEATEVDRNLVEAIEDPLMHMIRNAVDHGIEDAAAREKSGKPAVGRITLSARHEAGNIVITVTDDGRGLDKRRILEKAQAAGLIEPGRELSDAEIFNLIFHAGLSTAQTVTSVSGRGVGMDVVQRNIEQIRGRIDIQSAEEAGSTFTLRLPLTLMLIDGLLVRVADNIYIIPLSNVEQSIQLKPSQLSTVQGRVEMCMVRNALLPLRRLYATFAIEGAITDPLAGVAVIVHDGARRSCLMVDELLGQKQVVIKPLGEEAMRIPGIAGGAILGNGDVSLILDIPTLFDLPLNDAPHRTKELTA